MAGLFLMLTCGPAVVQAQEAQAATAFVASPRALERITTALASSPALDLDGDSLRFYVQVAIRQRTFAEYLRGSDTRFGMEHPSRYAAPGERPALPPGMGVDLLGLARSAIRGFRAAREQRQTREINEQIDRELQAIEAR